MQAFNGRGGSFLPTPMIGGFQRPMPMGGPGRGMPGMGAMPGRGMNGMMAGRGMNGMAGMPGFGMGGGLRIVWSSCCLDDPAFSPCFSTVPQ